VFAVTLVKCPHCTQQFDSVGASRTHVHQSHDDPGDSDDPERGWS
jgi:hypothetical protein